MLHILCLQRKSLLQKLNEAKRKHGTISVRFIKIIFTGSGAAGKTSFSHLLLNRKINQQHHSTNMIHASHAVSLRKAAFHKHASDQKVVWVEMDADLEISHLRSILLSEKPPSSVTAITEKQKTDQSQKSQTMLYAEHCKPEADKTKLFDAKPIQKPVSYTQAAKQWLTGLFTPSVNVENLSIFDTIVRDNYKANIASDVTTMHQPGDVLNIVTLLDTGGQPQYIHLLPTVNIYPTVNFVILNLTKKLDDQVLVEHSHHGKNTFKPYHLTYTNLEMTKLLMSSINDCSERSYQAPQLITHVGSDERSYLCFVGTHSDKVSAITRQDTSKLLTSMVDKTECIASVFQNKDGNVLFSVDNTTAGDETNEDPSADLIRNKIEEIVECKSIYDLPITWMLLELEIRQYCTKHKKLYISFRECVSLAEDCRLMSNSEEIKNALMYHHLLGVLLFFDEIPGLRDFVIVDHQWWFDRLSKIISFTFHEDVHCRTEILKLKYKGILSKEILQKVTWEGDIKMEYFLLLLAHLKIIAPLHKDEYFIPYILPACSTQQQNEVLLQYGELLGDSLLVQFQSGLLPRGLFCCLVVHLLQSPPLNWKPHFSEDNDYHVFSNLIIFGIPNAFSLSLLDKVSYLELQIRHKLISFATSSAVAVHADVHDKIMEALSVVCNQLNFDFQRIQVGFFCQCGESFEQHIAIVPTGTATPKLFATCSAKSTNQLQLKPSHLVWFNDGVSAKFGKIHNYVIL